MSDSIPFDTGKFYIGAPCNKGHGKETGGALRYKTNWVCVACNAERQRSVREPKTPEQLFWEKVDKDGPIHPVLGTSCWLWTAYTVSEGQVIERADFGTCPNDGCGERLNVFKVCRSCKQRQDWLAGQRAKIGAT